MDTKHAPLPWKAETPSEHITWIQCSHQNPHLINVICANKDDAALIVPACNAYYDVLEVLDKCEDYFDKRADAEYFTDSPAPVGNEEMTLLCSVREALAKLEAKP